MSSVYFLIITNTLTRKGCDTLLRMDNLFPQRDATVPASGIDHSQADREFMAQLLYGISESKAYIAAYCSHRPGVSHTQLASNKVEDISPMMLSALRSAAHRIILGAEGMALQRTMLAVLARDKGSDTGIPSNVSDDAIERLAVFWLSRALANPNGTRELRAARLLTRLLTPRT